MAEAIERTASIHLVPLDEAKKECRSVAGSFEDDILTAMIGASILAGENHTNRAFLTQKRRMVFDKFYSTIELLFTPIIAVTLLAYVDTNGDTITLAEYGNALKPFSDCPYALFKANINRSFIQKKHSENFPTDVQECNPEAVILEYTCGYGPTKAEVPEDIYLGCLMTAAHFYDNRKGERKIPDLAKDLWNAHKTMRA